MIGILIFKPELSGLTYPFRLSNSGFFFRNFSNSSLSSGITFCSISSALSMLRSSLGRFSSLNGICKVFEVFSDIFNAVHLKKQYPNVVNYFSSFWSGVILRFNFSSASGSSFSIFRSISSSLSFDRLFSGMFRSSKIEGFKWLSQSSPFFSFCSRLALALISASSSFERGLEFFINSSHTSSGLRPLKGLMKSEGRDLEVILDIKVISIPIRYDTEFK